MGAAAGVVTRSLAAIIDFLVVVALTLALVGVVAAGFFLAGPVSFRWPTTIAEQASLAGLAVAVGYPTVGWAVAGRTVGGAALGLRVLGRSGNRLGWPRSACRALLYVLVPVGLLWAAVSVRRRSVQDVLVASVVVYDGPPLSGA